MLCADEHLMLVLASSPEDNSCREDGVGAINTWAAGLLSVKHVLCSPVNPNL